MTSATGPADTRPGVSCIVPVHNERSRIGSVLGALIGHPLVDEVIVVDDGSTDGSGDLLREIEAIRLITFTENRGKTQALAAGIDAALGPLLLLVDGDLRGLTAVHVTALIGPVLAGHADIAVSLRENAPFLWRRIGLDFLSGERVFRKDLLAGQRAALRTLPRFGFEVHLNRLAIAHDCRFAIVFWKGVASPYKHVKQGLLAGVRADIGMIGDVMRTVSPIAALGQIRSILQRRV